VDYRPGFLHLCLDSIKGKYDHIEIAFIIDHDVYGCYVSRDSDVVKFEIRGSYDRFKESFHVSMFRLTNISPERELKMLMICRKLTSCAQPKRLSWFMQIMSAFPIPSEPLAMWWMDNIIEPSRPLTERTPKGTDPTRFTFCAALCAEILELPNPPQYTSTDIVEICIHDFGAVFDENPLPKQRPSDVVDLANIIRSEFVV